MITRIEENFFQCKVDNNVFEISFLPNLDLYLSCNILSDREFNINVGIELYNMFNFICENLKSDFMNKLNVMGENPFVNHEIIIYSDEEQIQNANILKIKKSNEKIVLSFIQNNELNPYNYCSVRIRNSGSRYMQVNVYFMQMFNKLKNEYPFNFYETNFIRMKK